MTPRLLSLLTLIETALADAGHGGKTSRLANYRRGVARLTFADGRGGVLVQNFTLADGRLCVRVELHRAEAAKPGEVVIYPEAPAFDWDAALTQVVRIWIELGSAITPLTEHTAATQEKVLEVATA